MVDFLPTATYITVKMDKTRSLGSQQVNIHKVAIFDACIKF